MRQFDLCRQQSGRRHSGLPSARQRGNFVWSIEQSRDRRMQLRWRWASHVAPGIFDVAPNSRPPFTIGFHARSLQLIPGSADNVDPKKNLDAAIFRVANANAVSSYQGGSYDTPAQAAAVADNMEVEKVGRTTQHTRGRVISQVYSANAIQYGVPCISSPVLSPLNPYFLSPELGRLFLTMAIPEA
jgi:hypothetical protein